MRDAPVALCATMPPLFARPTAPLGATCPVAQQRFESPVGCVVRDLHHRALRERAKTPCAFQCHVYVRMYMSRAGASDAQLFSVSSRAGPVPPPLMAPKKKSCRNICSFKDLERVGETNNDDAHGDEELPPRKVLVGSDCAGLLTEGCNPRIPSRFWVCRRRSGLRHALVRSFRGPLRPPLRQHVCFDLEGLLPKLATAIRNTGFKCTLRRPRA